jgi:hypothetical protein
VIDIVINILTAVISILPMSPFTAFIDSIGEISGLAMLNWFIPFDIFLVLLESWGVCMGIYYLYRVMKGNIEQ